jgi:hypothetical protein
MMKHFSKVVLMVSFMILHAQDAYVEGSGSTVFKSKFSGTSSSATAINGEALTDGSCGVYGRGGSYGLKGLATTGASRFGVHALAYNGTVNYGIYAQAFGGTTSWAGYFSGNIFCTGQYQSSDERLKKNIKPIGSVLDKLSKVNPIRYEYDETKMKGLPKGDRIGFSAQNLESIFPECVKDVSMPVIDNNGEMTYDISGEIITKSYKAVTYDEMIPVLLSAIKEQQQQINELKRNLLK